MERKTKIPVTRVNMWYDEGDFELDMDVAKEFLENDSNFRVVLFAVDRVNTQVDDVYMETDVHEVRFHPPVEITVSGLKIQEGELKSYAGNGTLSFKDRGNLEFSVLITTLKEKGVDIKRGDFIGYSYSEEGIHYWSVTDDGRTNMDNKHTVYGTRPYYRSVKCVAADPNVFNAL
jgi:hypothetical protein